MKFVQMLLVLIVPIAALVSCGGGGSGSGGAIGNTTGDIVGIAATGQALSGAAITAKCVAGSVITTTTDSGGIYRLELSPSHSPPCLIRVVGLAPSQTLFGFAAAIGRANISPLTDLVLTNAVRQDMATVFANFEPEVFTALSNALPASVSFVQREIGKLLGSQFSVDPMNGVFSVGDSNDQLLDALANQLAKSSRTFSDLRDAAKSNSSFLELSTPVATSKFLVSDQPFDATIQPFGLPVYFYNHQTALLSDGSLLAFQSADGGDFYNPQPIVLAHLDSSGRLISTKAIGAVPGGYLATIRSDGVGGAIVAWVQAHAVGDSFRARIHVRYFHHLSGLGEEIVLAPDQYGSASGAGLKLVVRPDGTATIAWAYLHGNQYVLSGGYAIYAAEFGADKKWTMPKRVSNIVSGELLRMDISTSPNGNTAAIWVEPIPHEESYPVLGAASRLQVAIKGQGTNWGSPTSADAVFGATLGDVFPNIKVQIADSGSAMVVWALESNRGSYYRRFQAGTGWLPKSAISTTGSEPTLAMNKFGDGFVAWSEPSFAAVAVARFNESGWQGSLSLLTNSDTISYFTGGSPSIFIDDRGNAYALYNALESQRLVTSPIYTAGNRYTPATGWSAPFVFGPRESLIRVATASLDADGQGLVLWTQTSLAAGGDSKQLFARFSLVP